MLQFEDIRAGSGFLFVQHDPPTESDQGKETDIGAAGLTLAGAW